MGASLLARLNLYIIKNWIENVNIVCTGKRRLLTPDWVLTHFLLPTCWSDPPVVKLNWCPPHDEYKPSATPSVTSPTGCTHFPLVVWIKLPLSSLNSSLVYNKTDVSRVTVNFVLSDIYDPWFPCYRFWF